MGDCKSLRKAIEAHKTAIYWEQKAMELRALYDLNQKMHELDFLIKTLDINDKQAASGLGDPKLVKKMEEAYKEVETHRINWIENAKSIEKIFENKNLILKAPLETMLECLK